jgi:hypothetical protein
MLQFATAVIIIVISNKSFYDVWEAPDTDFAWYPSGRIPDIRMDFQLNIQMSIRFSFPVLITGTGSIFYLKAVLFQDDIFGNFMNWCGYLFNLPDIRQFEFGIRLGYPDTGYQ